MITAHYQTGIHVHCIMDQITYYGREVQSSIFYALYTSR